MSDIMTHARRNQQQGYLKSVRAVIDHMLDPDNDVLTDCPRTLEKVEEAQKAIQAAMNTCDEEYLENVR